MSDLEKFVSDPMRNIGDRFGEKPGDRHLDDVLATVMLDKLGRFWKVSLAHEPGSAGSSECHNIYTLAFDPDPERQRAAFKRRDLAEHGPRDGHDGGSDIPAILRDTAGP